MNQVNKIKTRPTEHPTMLDIAWAAGLYEGEGHCGVTSNGSKGSFYLKISQKDTFILEKLRAKFGGSLTPATDTQVCAQWSVYGARARGFMYTIYSFLSPRRRSQLKEKLALA